MGIKIVCNWELILYVEMVFKGPLERAFKILPYTEVDLSGLWRLYCLL